MQWTVNHTCGHTVTHQIYGGTQNGKDRSAWLATQPCASCKNAARLAEREMANVVAASDNAAAGLPALIGSAKQIAWAETIRREMLAEIREHITANLDRISRLTTKDPAEQPAHDACVVAMRAGAFAAIATIQQKSEAKWWIDNRDNANKLMIQVGEAGNAAYRTKYTEVTGKALESPEEARARKAAEEQAERERIEAARPPSIATNHVDVPVTWANGTRRGVLSMDVNNHVEGEPIFVHDDDRGDAYGPGDIDDELVTSIAISDQAKVILHARAYGFRVVEQ